MLKHVVLVQVLAHLAAKEAPIWFVDSHAGAGAYALEGAFAQKKGEFKEGIGRLWGREGLPAAIADYVAQVRACNPDGVLRHYPGSPQIAHQMLRPQDHLQLFEMHVNEAKALQRHFAGAGRRVSVRAADGFSALKAVLPPASRRGFVLIDPSYEDKDDYRQVLVAMREALRRFATGVYAVWYPLIQRQDAQDLPSQLKQLSPGHWLQASLTVKAPATDGVGLHGSGVFVFNQPWTLAAALRPALSSLVGLLGQDAKATCKLLLEQA